MNNKKTRLLVHMLEWITAATASSSEETDNIFILSICEVISNCSAKNTQSIDGVMIEVLFTTVKHKVCI